MGTADQPTDEFDAQGAGPATGVADPPLIAAGKRLGARYRLERPLGHGGMASVWLATDERLDRQVAVKILSDALAHDDEYLDRFRREAHVVAGLQHPNLVPVYDFGAGERPYLVMEYIPGGDLARRVEAGDVPDPESLARELLSALRHIHSAGVLHRDIKPQNVLIDAAGHARLTDFGIAQPARRDRADQDRPRDRNRELHRSRGQGGRAGERARRPLRARRRARRRRARGRRRRALGADRPPARPDPERRPRSAAAALAPSTAERTPASPATATQPFADHPADRGRGREPARPHALRAVADRRPEPARATAARARPGWRRG